MLLVLTCKWPNSYMTSTSCLTTGVSILTNVQYLTRSSTMADRRLFLSTSSSSALCWLTVCIDESTKFCKLSPICPFLAFFCRRSVSLERFFNSARHLLYSLACSLSITTVCFFQSSSLSWKNEFEWARGVSSRILELFLLKMSKLTRGV